MQTTMAVEDIKVSLAGTASTASRRVMRSILTRNHRPVAKLVSEAPRRTAAPQAGELQGDDHLAGAGRRRISKALRTTCHEAADRHAYLPVVRDATTRS